jgi:hypothetical protein
MNSFSPLVNKNSTQNADSKTNRNAARLAETQENKLPELPEKCSPQFALNAAARLRFLSNPLMTDLFIAAIASQRREIRNRSAKALKI